MKFMAVMAESYAIFTRISEGNLIPYIEVYLIIDYRGGHRGINLRESSNTDSTFNSISWTVWPSFSCETDGFWI